MTHPPKTARNPRNALKKDDRYSSCRSTAQSERTAFGKMMGKSQRLFGKLKLRGGSNEPVDQNDAAAVA